MITEHDIVIMSRNDVIMIAFIPVYLFSAVRCKQPPLSKSSN